MTTESADILAIAGLSVAFETRRGRVEAVRDLSLSLKPGECLGVVGESGSGKSQTFLAALGLVPANARVTGSARFRGEELIGLKPAALNRIRGAKVAMVFQDPLTAMAPHLTIGFQLAEPLRKHLGLGAHEAMRRAQDWLSRVRIPEAARRLQQYPHELSGGMRQRVMIAMAMACEPDVLIADEPTTALDVTVQAEVLDLMAELRRQSNTAIVLITHDMGVVARLADRVCVMEAGRSVEAGDADQVFYAPRQAYTRRLLAAAAGGPTDLDGQAVTLAPVSPDAPVVLEVTDMEVGYDLSRGLFARPQRLRAVDGVSFTLRAGETLGVVGESGCGKSSLARAVMRLVRPTAGIVTLLGQDIGGLDEAGLRAARKDLQIVFQDPFASLDPRQTVGVSIGEPLRVYQPGQTTAAREARVREALAQVGLPPAFAHRYPHELSGGQNQRVGIARAMILEPRLVVCDEAVSALDASVRGQVLALILKFQRALGVAILFISHDLAVVSQVSHRVMVLHLGRVVEMADAVALFGDPRHPYTRALLSAVLSADPRRERSRPPQPPRGEPPSPLDPVAHLVFLPSRRDGAPAGYRPQLIEVAPGHFVAEHE